MADPCTCRKDIEAKLLEKFKAAEPAAGDHRAHLMGYGINFTTGGLSIAMPIEYEAQYLVKSTGVLKYKKHQQNMVFNFCPFCGIKIREKQ